MPFLLLKLIVLISSLITLINCDGESVLGCGGFIKSHVPIDFSKIEVKLLTKQGFLKDKTSCAPNTGYYFVPLYDKGEYFLELEPPPGWSFVNSKMNIVVDGVSDVCSQGKDINFVFKGFGITGKVESLGTDEGPAGVTVHLQSSTEKRTTVTGKNGDFFFTPVDPGKYAVSISHPKWKIVKDSITVTVAEGNTDLPPKSLIVQGYDVSGMVKSDGAPVKNVKILLFTQDSNPNAPVEGCHKQLKENFDINMLCYVESNENGVYTFPTVPVGKYFVRPFYENKNIYFEPEAIKFEVDHGSVNIAQDFRIIGFSVIGRVTKFDNVPVKNARVLLNGIETAVTDDNGYYKLERIKTGTYTVKIEADDLEFKDVSIKLDPSLLKLPDTHPHQYKICGTVVSRRPEQVVFQNVETGGTILVESNPKTGQFCKLIPTGTYNVMVNTNPVEKERGLRFFPLTQTVVVPSKEMNTMTFSHLRATVSGEVKCIREKDCLNLKVTLKPLSDIIDDAENIAPVTNKRYLLTNISPGSYMVILHSNKLCWKENEQKITINSEAVIVPPFIQTGYQVIFISSHDTKVAFTPPGQNSVSSIEVSKGRSLHCVKNAGNYIFQLHHSCHTYESPKIPFSTDSGMSEIFLNALKHDVKVSIKAEEDYGDLSLNVDTEAHTQLVSLSFLNGAYDLHLTLGDGEKATITPRSDFLYFHPKSMVVYGTNDCQDLGTIFEAKKGRVIKGKVTPPLFGVKITVEIDGEDARTTETDNKGFYKFPPLDDTKNYKIAAHKESYVITGPNSEGDFFAHKLAEIVVEVFDEADKAPLQGTLLSLSGGEGYRSNFKTDELGKITFPSLNPGEYFLRPMMKEYTFMPVSKIITVKEGETINISLVGKRVAYSAFGVITSLSGEPEKDVIIVAEGTGNCSHFSEESTSEFSGHFRIRGLQPYCSYHLKVKGTIEDRFKIERSAPSSLLLDKITQDVKDLKMIIFRPVSVTDVLVKIHSENPEYYKTLKLIVNRESSPYGLIHTVKVNTSSVKLTRDYNPGVLVYLPPITLDGKQYSVQLESNLPPNRRDQQTKYFVANSSFAYIDFEFKVRSPTSDQQIKQTSLWTLVVMFAVLIILYRVDILINFLKEKLNFSVPMHSFVNLNKFNNNGRGAAEDDIDKIVESINAPKRKMKVKRA